MVESRYEMLARTLRRQIDSQVWLPGDRLPSLRDTCKQSGLSLMTVLQAYQLLESQGVIVARPQSGYYVAAGVQRPVRHSPDERLHAAEQVDVNDAIFDILKAGQDPAVVPLGSAFPDPTLFPQPRLARSLASAVRRMSPHSAIANLPPGNEELRRSIAQRYAQNGIEVAPDEIVITSGAMESLGLSLQAVTEPGDWVAIESPAFYGVLQAIERRKLKAVAIPTDVRLGMDPDALEKALETYPIKACWLMSSFQNPLGCSLPPENKARLVAILQAYKVALIEDDVYSELYFGSERTVPLKASDYRNEILHCSSFSKCLAPGFRVGWVAAGAYAERIQRLQLMSTLSASVPVQLALADYLQGGQQGGYDTHLRRLRRQLEQRQLAMRHAIIREFPPQVSVSQPAGGYFQWLDLGDNVDAARVYQRALAKGVSVAPGTMFSADERFRHCLRLNTSFEWGPHTARAISILAALVAEEIKG
ncbi:PLP-dependent aminotransferase family protein [Rahnella woolbedingensis]|uniref:PLP-dependent aminotransferase family protein n=1 Tax=Rahnella woolbedingensis TaxID=1510574 RepID=A0A419N7G5_9GAMM|nr:PLP-dependent aminotransferase family protein [Rahnella woolbedingensis]RJT43232.1 PLP-dependent aminotransferase family protein [Rahnella woolbedingensis]